VSVRRWSFAVLAVLFGAAAVSCSSDSGDDDRAVDSARTPSDAAATTAMTASQSGSAAAVIAAFDDAPQALRRSISAINEHAFTDPASLREEALVELDSGAPSRRFASVLAITLTASTDDARSMEALRALAAADDVTERMLAAGTLAALGDKAGIAGLIEGLASDELLRNTDPPFAAWRFARANLLLMVDQDLGLVNAHDPAAAAAAQPAWRRWWAEQSAGQTWNAEMARYEASS
jgi:hypothetical protein